MNEHSFQDGRCFELRPGCPRAEDRSAKDRSTKDRSAESRSGVNRSVSEICEDCRLYGSAVAGAQGHGPSAAPASLKDRLRAVARPAVPRPSDEDLDRVAASAFETTTSNPPASFEDPVLELTRDLLAETQRETRRPQTMPEGLRARLQAIVPDPEGLRDVDRPVAAVDLPWWIADSRWTTAACALLTAALTLTAGDASARFVELRDAPAKSTVTSWLSVGHLQKIGGEWLEVRLAEWAKARDGLRSGAKDALDDASETVRQKLPKADVGAELDTLHNTLQDAAASTLQDWKGDLSSQWNRAGEEVRRAADDLRRKAGPETAPPMNPATVPGKTDNGAPANPPTLKERAKQSFDDLARWARTTFEPAQEPEENPKERKTP